MDMARGDCDYHGTSTFVRARGVKFARKKRQLKKSSLKSEQREVSGIESPTNWKQQNSRRMRYIYWEGEWEGEDKRK